MKNQYTVTVKGDFQTETYTFCADNSRNAEVLAAKRFNREWPTEDIASVSCA